MKLHSIYLVLSLFFNANAWSDRPLPLHIYSQIEKERILIGKSTQTYLGHNRYMVNTRADGAICDKPWKSEGYLACIEAATLRVLPDLPAPRSRETVVTCESYVYVTSDKLKAEYGPEAQLQFCRHKLYNSDYTMPTGLLWAEGGEARYRPIPENFFFQADIQDMSSRPTDYAKNYQGFQLVHESVLNSCPYIDCESGKSKNSLVCLKREITDILSRIENFEENTKEDKLDRYFKRLCKTPENKDSSHTCSPTEYQTYRKDFKRMLEVASATFDIPLPVLACLAFQESKWDIRAESKSKANGISQLMPIAAREIHGRIETSPETYPSMSVYKWDHCPDCDATFQPLTGEENFYRNAWVRYHNVLLSDPHHRKSVPPKGDRTTTYADLGIPRSFSADVDRFIPPNAIGGMAAYLKFLEFENSQNVKQNFLNDPLEFNVLLSAAYNTGPKALRETPKVRGKRQSFNAFLARVKLDSMGSPDKLREVENHIKQVRACLKATWVR